jgi:hypothetical protein
MGRGLDSNERDVLMKMLAASFDGVVELRNQVSSVVVTGGTFPTWLDLRVAENVQKSNVEDGPIPVSAWACDDAGEEIGTVLVWVKDGRLSALEYGWVTDDRPISFPAPDSIRIISD